MMILLIMYLIIIENRHIPVEEILILKNKDVSLTLEMNLLVISTSGGIIEITISRVVGLQLLQLLKKNNEFLFFGP